MTRRRILLIEDETSISEPLARALEREGFHVVTAATAAQGLAAFCTRVPDLVLLDVMLPDADGRDILREIRSSSRTPVVMLTARGDELDRVLGLELGADDYIVKPFSPAELVARITAVLRRRGGTAHPSKLEFEGLTLDIESRKLTINGRAVATTTKEFDLLAFLASSPSHVFTRGELLDKVWGSSAEWQDPGTVTEHVRRVRHLIEDDPARPQRIRTVRGVGYSFEP